MSLKLDDYTVPGFGLTVSLSATLKDEDASGDTSGTARAKKGNKGKKLEVRVNIPFTRADDMRELMRVAEATSGGDGKLYTITNDTANTAGMRQGRFSGSITVAEADNLRLWEVSFSLAEQVSVPEMAEAREGGKAAAAQTSAGENIGPADDGGESGGEAEAQTQEEMGTAEKLLKSLDDWIGPGDDEE